MHRFKHADHLRTTMLLAVENEVDPNYRYFGEELRTYLPDARVFDSVHDEWPPNLDGVDAVVIGGSTAGVYEADDYTWMDDEKAFIRNLVDERIPTLGICFGHQIINEALGGTVEHHGLKTELVEATLTDDPLFEGIAAVVPAVHGDFVVERGKDMEPIASADYYESLATRHRSAPVWTTQFHPEFTDRLLDRVTADFGWHENDLSFADVNVEQVVANFLGMVPSE